MPFHIFSPHIYENKIRTKFTENNASFLQLRKAYFRQVEEIRSLKEQISLKDKRIRQLEEELQSLRDDKELEGESNC